MSFTCQAGLILPCKNEPVGQCEYCDRRFCAQHGSITATRIPDRPTENISVCRRHLRIFRREESVWLGWEARQKQLDADRAERVRGGAARNAQGQCAYPNCTNASKYICDSIPGSCGNRFCHLHIRDAFVRVCPECDKYNSRTRRIADERTRLVADLREPFRKW